MKAHRLDVLVSPTSLAVVVAGKVQDALVERLLANISHSGFAEPKVVIRCSEGATDESEEIGEIATLAFAPDLSVVLADARFEPKLLSALARRGCKSVVLLGQGDCRQDPEVQNAFSAAVTQAARYGRLRIFGPNALGLVLPRLGLNASLALGGATKGSAAFLTRSNAMMSLVLGEAAAQGVGFTVAASLGRMFDIDFAEMLDHLALDAQTRVILLHIDEIPNARRLLSAVRKVTRLKPVVVLHAPLRDTAPGPATSEIDDNAVFDEVCRRVGILRVTTVGEMLVAARTLSGRIELDGDRLAICANDRSITALASDLLQRTNTGRAIGTREGNSCRNLALDAAAAEYGPAVAELSAQAATSGILLIHVPAIGVDAQEVAEAVAKASPSNKPVFAVWFANAAAIEEKFRSSRARILHYAQLEHAVAAFRNLVRQKRSQSALMEMPSAPADPFDQDRDGLKRLLAQAAKGNRCCLTEPEALLLPAAYGLATTRARLAGSPKAAAEAAKLVGFPVDLFAADENGCVIADAAPMRGLRDPDAVETAASWLVAAHAETEGAHLPLSSVVVKAAVAPLPFSPHFRLLAAVDRTFGPALQLRRAEPNTVEEVESIVALPPLTHTLALQTADSLWSPRSGVLPAEAGEFRDELAKALGKVAQVMADFAEIAKVDLSLIRGEGGCLTVRGAFVGIGTAQSRAEARLALPSYPGHLESRRRLRDGSEVLIRPIRPEDEALMHAWFARLSAEDIRLRFFSALKELDRRMAVRMTQIDYDREMSMVAVSTQPGPAELLGIASLNASAEFDEAEYAITVRTDLKGSGLGRVLMLEIIDYAITVGVREIWGEVRRENAPMLGLLRKLGFAMHRDPEEPGVMRVSRLLSR